MEQSASPAIAPPRLPPESGAPAGPAVFVPEGEIEGLSFRGVALPSEDCSRLSVQGCRFSGCRLGGAVFRGSRFTDVLFRNCDLSVADLQGASFFRVRFEECKIAGAGFAETTLQHVVFGHCKGEFVNFSRSRLRSVRFAGAQLRGGFFDGCRLERVVFSQCGLVTADFSGTRLAGISFADSDIRDIRLREVVSPELKGLRVSPEQAVGLARLLGVEIGECPAGGPVLLYAIMRTARSPESGPRRVCAVAARPISGPAFWRSPSEWRSCSP